MSFNNMWDIIRIAGRENNAKRPCLFVNLLQAKHIPVCPHDALRMFEALGKKVANRYPSETMLVIGFAETATAIGAYVAQSLGGDTRYIHTTREACTGETLYFFEEHSHATEQNLSIKNWASLISGVDRVLFVEDEISTGKTIMNFITALRNAGLAEGMRFSVASILNGLNEQNICRFAEVSVECMYLFKTDAGLLDNEAMTVPMNGERCICQQHYQATEHIVHGHLDARCGVHMASYEAACCELARQIELMVRRSSEGPLLVLGTEEFMYPAVVTAAHMESVRGLPVVVHATTRSPIVANNEICGYPLRSRYPLRSVYNPERQTFVYNLAAYCQAIVITDANEATDAQGKVDLFIALSDAGCNDIQYFRWAP